MLLNEAHWNEGRINSTLRSMETTRVPIKRSILVDLYYLTAWVNTNNRLQYRTDIYGYDKKAFASMSLLTPAKYLIQ
jgi:murein L,D-transpeptidase YcbB/YkuD